MRLFLGLIIGLLVGGMGAVLFTQSLPPDEGSLAERAERAEFELGKAQRKIDELTAKASPYRRQRSSQDAVRSIAEQIRTGRSVNLDDVFKRTIKPWMRDLAPLFDRSRTVQQKRRYDRLAGELTRRYDLNERQQDALTAWLGRQAEAKNQKLESVLNDETTGFVAFAKAMDEREEHGLVDGLDDFMAQTLEEDALTDFQRDRMQDRVERVQNEAEGKVQRLDSMVGLDEPQKDAIFAVMARSSNYFDPNMQFEGLENDASPLTPGASREQAIQEILTEEQASVLASTRKQRLQDALQEFQEIGLMPPEGWEEMEMDPF